MVAPKRNLPDPIHLRTMREQRLGMQADIAGAVARFQTAKRKLDELSRHENRHRSAELAAASQEVGALQGEHDALQNCEVVDTMWCDPERTDDTAFGGFGCWGDDITDVRLEARRFKRDPVTGAKLPGQEFAWQLCQILQVGSNRKDKRTVCNASHFRLIVADPDGSNKRAKTLREMTANLRTLFPDEGLDAPRAEVDKVAVAHRMAFVPVPSDTKNWGVEVRYVCYGYNTVRASEPKNLLLFGDTMNTSVFTEKPARLDGFQPLYTKVRTSITANGAEDAEPKMRCFATAVEATNRTIKNIGTETKEESAAAAAAGKGTQVRTGPITLVGTSSCAWHVAVPIEPPPPPPPPPPCGQAVIGRRVATLTRSLAGYSVQEEAGDAELRSLGGLADEEEAEMRGLGAESDDDADDAADTPPPGAAAVHAAQSGDPIYRSGAHLVAPSAAKPDDGIADADRVGDGAPSKRATAREARIGIGSYVEDAEKLAVANPVAKPTPAIATAIYIMTIPVGTVPDKQTVVDAATMLKKRHRESSEIGVDVDDRLSQEAVDQGLTAASPLHKKAKQEIEETVGCKIWAPRPPSPPTIARGRPLLAGVPAE